MHEQLEPATTSAAAQLFALGAEQIGRIIAGQNEAIEQALLTALCGGHALLGLTDIPIDPVPHELLYAARNEIRSVRVEPALFDYILAVVRRTREWPALALGASPRAAAALLLVAKGLAARDSREFVLPDDVKEAALPVLRHRLVLRPEAELEGLDPDRVLRDILAATPLPK